jgi:hypothetical protein
MVLPKHFGQSGQPIPEPVLRTNPPRMNNKKTETALRRQTLLKNFSLNTVSVFNEYVNSY